MSDRESVDGRCATLLRTWRVLLLLRARPHTIDELAGRLRVTTRTIRRDLAVLQAIPLPLAPRFADGSRPGVPLAQRRVEPNVWILGAMPAWPRPHPTPIAEPLASHLPESHGQ